LKLEKLFLFGKESTNSLYPPNSPQEDSNGYFLDISISIIYRYLSSRSFSQQNKIKFGAVTFPTLLYSHMSCKKNQKYL